MTEQAIRTAESPTVGISRGTGFTLKEFKQRVNAYMKRKGMAKGNGHWWGKRTAPVQTCAPTNPWAAL